MQCKEESAEEGLFRKQMFICLSDLQSEETYLNGTETWVTENLLSEEEKEKGRKARRRGF